ncbi:CCHC-type zinc finger transcription factor [Phycomyces blakesleeanus NRRL 1555(-)]|uniref:CCHC-type zinc finger transcription factor n=1 Tax=Phycomyces blakesleeanus (strain ATCC 8743b / DSM 1359 / FGSC 10004 / NBRC 33097 / NRRL 1555) TaxID=763407 RepID=A0A167KK53_PHYB8|nr:CCHC-type zinc finger transcription factor [Phycomyces blakesleeanus NRRL 1555(-)]OAD68276.1 CCHC-type zinc finger transcription factor [Phycomyces blakesleeanus NRRL 1555(-)]|eukprot:XP_018286316.1 CCHC-type zinc finger transcription factor [Phycomyces blakesleeanus NRRL 1555(-)]
MGHAIKNCPNCPKDSQRCFTCDQTGHLQHACPRAPPTDASSSKKPDKILTTPEFPDCSCKTIPEIDPPHGAPMMAEESQATTTTSCTNFSTPQQLSVPAVPTSPCQSANRFAALDGLTDSSRTGVLVDPTLPLPQTHNTQYVPIFHPLQNAFLPSNYTSGSTKDKEEFHPSTFDSDNNQDSQHILTDDEMADGNHS